MDGQNDDDYLFSGRDRSSFELQIRMAESKKQLASILECFETTEEYFNDAFPEQAKEVTDLPDDPATPE